MTTNAPFLNGPIPRRYPIRKLSVVALACIILARTGLPLASASLTADLKAASAKAEDVRERAEALSIRGQVAEANRLLLDFFPADQASSIEKLVIGNVLFRQAPEAAYRLHQAAAQELPNFASAQLEWALDQHRRKEYVGAAATYAVFSRLQSDYAPALGLAAECAIRNGDVGRAVELWNLSEKAPRGTLEEFEALVCEINGRQVNDQAREELLIAVRKGDVTAATKLLMLDVTFNADWWNEEPSIPRLEHDLPLIAKFTPRSDTNLAAALCIADHAMAAEKGATLNLSQRLTAAGIFIGGEFTLPSDGRVLAHLLHLILQDKIMTATEARTRYSDRILLIARDRKDPELYNVAAFLNLGTAALPAIDLEGWEVTQDSRFAASLLAGKMGAGSLKLNDELLTRALRDFPEDSTIAGCAVELATAEKCPLAPYLVAGIKAEYTKFSSNRPGVDFSRPSAYMLRSYFSQLAKLQPAKSKQNKMTWTPKPAPSSPAKAD